MRKLWANPRGSLGDNQMGNRDLRDSTVSRKQWCASSRARKLTEAEVEGKWRTCTWCAYSCKEKSRRKRCLQSSEQRWLYARRKEITTNDKATILSSYKREALERLQRVLTLAQALEHLKLLKCCCCVQTWGLSRQQYENQKSSINLQL